MGLPEKIPSVYQLALENQRLILENHDLTLQLITLLVQSKHQEPEFSLFYAHSLLEIKEWQIEHIEYLLT